MQQILTKIKNIKQESISKAALSVLVLTQLLGNLFFFLSFRVGIVFSLQRICILLLGALCVFMLIKKRVLLKSIAKYTGFALCFFAFWIAYGLIGLIFVHSRIEGLKQLVDLLQCGLVLLALAVFMRTETDLKLVIRLLKLCAAVIFIIFAVQLVTQGYFSFSRYNSNYIDYVIERDMLLAPTTVFYNENDMCAILILINVFFVFDMIRESRGFKVFYNCLGSIICFFIIATSDSQLAEAAVIFTLIFALVFLIMRKREAQKISLASSELVLAVILFELMGQKAGEVLANLKYSFMSISIGGRGRTLLSTAQLVPLSSAADTAQAIAHSSQDSRLNLTKEGFGMLWRSFFLGVGANHYQYNIKHPEKVNNLINPHNLWIEVLSQYGVLVFVPFAFLYFRAAYKNLKAAFKKGGGELQFAMAALSVVFIFSSILPSSSISLYPIWIFFGMVLVYGERQA
ncbi:MAG: O-antigen ligase family protein [Oscillospiraceae bacterium]|nr:O-antigen ligase family protein [Oscillospiraceae bacterium]